MSSTPSTLNGVIVLAHQHAANADDFLAKRTLHMLYNEHSRAGKELLRRIEKLKEDGVDPSLPQKPSIPRPPSVPTHLASRLSPSPPPHMRGRMSDSQHTVDESFMLLGQQSADAGDAFNTFWKAMEVLDHLSQPVGFATASLGLPESSRRALGREGSGGSDTDYEDASRSRRGLVKGQSRLLSPDNSFATAYDGDVGRGMAKSTRIKQSVVDLRNDFDEIVDEDYDSSDSFCMIPSKSEPSPSTLKKEIVALRSDLEATQGQLEAAEQQLKLRREQDQQLRDNIVLARREAQRAMGASLMSQRQGQSAFDLNSLNLGLVPTPSPMVPVNPGRDREPQLLRRIRELEEEVRTVRVENEKQVRHNFPASCLRKSVERMICLQKTMIAKFRERWDKLKESAKRKREARAAADAHNSPVHERIDEEPEAEDEQDEQHA
ncbi:hypothetical protein EW146_g5654 [Bondarzewia mesenterica]|uniref:Uncharacterized protein n=1 Tax=Bondarzewia mesenterica TaxID=1095465 RepID=A0A4S4LSP1_9AGAM|nr:hypothetical protein EW146_g5654 [Bondarzewia mesenterica]